MEGLCTLISTEFDEKRPIDYIVISGDLAQAGSEKDYKVFMDLLLKPILDVFLRDKKIPLPKLITIPGNHDVFWKEGKFFKEYLTFILTEEKEITRSEFLEKKKSDFDQLFIRYSNFINNNCSGKYEEFFSLSNTPGVEITPAYINHRLCGHLIDHKRRLILVLFNTAWYCFGGTSHTIFSEEIISRIEKSRSSVRPVSGADVAKWLKTQDEIAEHSHLVSGVEYVWDENLISNFKKYPDYYAISCMHHPRNWLEWQESYTYSPGKNNNANKLTEILNYSDLLLSGHEHMPLDIKSETILEDTLHLKGGCFLFDNQTKHYPERLKNCWLSILDINTDKREFTQVKLFFDDEDEFQNWRRRPITYKSPIEHFQEYKIPADRLAEVKILIAKASGDKLKRFLKNQLDEHNSYANWMKLPHLHEIDYDIYKGTRDKGEELCIIAKTENFYQTFVLAPSFTDLIKGILIQHQRINKVRFVVLDLFVDRALADGYQMGQQRDQLLNRVVQRADNLFDVYRHNFFSGFDVGMHRGSAVITAFKRFSNISMINMLFHIGFAKNFGFKKKNVIFKRFRLGCLIKFFVIWIGLFIAHHLINYSG